MALGAALADALVTGDLLVLAGDLGAGKTKLVQGIGRGLGVEEAITSPTFALANRYETDRTDGAYLHHLDVYRLNVVGEVMDLDLPDLLDSGITAIEWGEQIEAVLPTEHLLVTLEYCDDGPNGDADNDLSGDATAIEDHRIIRFTAADDAWMERMARLAEVLQPWIAVPNTDRGQDS